MLKFLTHKLRTHSINEEPYPDQVDEDHDSGTESDDEIDPQELVTPVVLMDGMERMCSVSPADTGCSMESPIPSLILSVPATDAHDPHSSEEELEVINSTSYSPIQSPGLMGCGIGTGNNGSGPLLPLIHHHHHLRLSSSPAAVVPTCSAAEKRKWSEVGELSSGGSYGGLIRYSSPENEENMSHYGNLSPAESPPCCIVGRYYGEELGVVVGGNGGSVLEHSGSSDDEVHNLLSTPPLQFRTSPPLEALKPHHPPSCHSISPAITTTTPCTNGRRTPHTKIILRSASEGAGSPPPAKVPAQQQQQLLMQEDGASRYYYCGGYSNEVAAATVAASPRKRSRYGRDGREKFQGNNRPYLDFEKMQQLKTHSVTWRSGEQKRGGELSLCVW